MAVAASVTRADSPVAAIDYKALLQNCHQEVCWDSSAAQASLSQTQHLTLPSVRIVYTTRAMVVMGDLGEGDITSADSKNMHWAVTGHVQVFAPQGHLGADRATIQIVNLRITTVTAQGAPAQFERAGDSPLPANMPPNAQAQLEHAHGHADEIVFDVDRNQLDFSGEAYFIANCYELGSQHIVYDMANQKVQGDSSDNSGVRGSFKCGPGAQKP